uniref:RING-type E3 ubiquitin transferase n=1 Tax=viral metagenome TaxID=1070528 RepID=A0A6C0CZZ8_9ZZZZ
MWLWLEDNEANNARIFDALFRLLDKVKHDILMEHIINESFQNQTVHRKSTLDSVIKSLNCSKCTEDTITCCICQLNVDKGDNLIELPCGHMFHGEGCECPGIKPWLEDNNTCPLCKHELPVDLSNCENQDTKINDIRPLLEDEVDGIVNKIIFKILDGDIPNINDIKSSNIELMDTIRRNISIT